MPGTVAVIGLGNMGAAMARTLHAAGHHVLGVDPDPQAADRAGPNVTLVEPGDAFSKAPTLLLSLPGSSHVDDVLLGPAGLVPARPGHRLVIDTSTSNPLSSRDVARRLATHGHSYVDAPVSGGPAGAATGSLTAFLGGDDAALAEAADVLDALTRHTVHVGGPGSGHVAKLVNNLLCATHLQIAGEGLRMAQAAGIDAARLVEAVNTASGRSAVTEVNLPTWVLSGTYDSGFTLGLMARDVGLATQTARALGVEAPLADAVATRWCALRDQRGPDDDFNRMAQP